MGRRRSLEAPLALALRQREGLPRAPVHAGAAVDSLDGKTADSPDWATIEVLDVHGALDGLQHYDLRSLVVLGGLVVKDLDTVLAHPSLSKRLLGLGVKVSADDDGVFERLARFPRLRFLAWDGVPKTLLAHPLLKRLELLAVADDRRLPKSLGPTVLGTYIYAARWLPHFDELQRRVATPHPA